MTDTSQKSKFENNGSQVRSATSALGFANSTRQATSISRSRPKIQTPESADANSGFKLPRLSPQQLQFLLRVVPPALESEHVYRVPACVTVAQAIIESATLAGWGSSSLFLVANNPFGIKYEHFGSGDRIIGPSNHRGIVEPEKHSSDRPSTQSSDQANSEVPKPAIPADYGHFDSQTWEIVNGQKTEMLAQFQKFPNLAEGFRCHALLLARSPRYAPAMATLSLGPQVSGTNKAENPSSNTWKKFAERLGPKTSPLDSEHCGYSTNPSYSAALIKLVELYRLNDSRTMEFYATGKVGATESRSEETAGSS